MVPAGVVDGALDEPDAAPGARRPRRRRRQLVLRRRPAPLGRARRAGRALRRLRRQRRRLGPDRGLRPDGRRRRRGDRAAHARAAQRSRPASTRRRARPAAAGDPAPEEEGWIHCGPSGAGHFVKMVHNGIEYGHDGGLRGGAEPARARQRRRARSARSTRRRRRCATPSTTATRSTPRRSPRPGGAAPSCAPGCSTWPPRRSPTDPALGHLAGPRLGLRRGALDGARGDRHRHADPGPDRRAVQQRFSSRGEADFADRLLSAMREQFGGHAEKPGRPGGRVVRRRGERGRRARHLRDDRRPRVQADLPGAAADGPGRRPERAGRRRRARALEPRQAAQPRAREPGGQHGRARPGGVREALRR